MTQPDDRGERVASLADLDVIVDCDAHVTEHVDDLLPYVPERYSGVRRILEKAAHPLYDVYTVSHPTPPSIDSAFGDIYSEESAPTRLRRAKLDEMAQFDIDYGVLDPTLNLAINTVDDPRIAIALASAYDEWLLDTFLDDAERLKGTILVAPQKPAESAALIDDYAGEDDYVGVSMPSTGLTPPAGHEWYEPIYDAAERHGLPVCFHGAASATFHSFPGPRRWNNTYAEDHALVHPFTQMWTLTTLVYRGVPERHPDLDFVFQESGIGWIPYTMWRLDDHYMELSQDLPELTKLPSEYVHDQCYFSTQPLGLTADAPSHLASAIEMAGPDSIMYASDLPHADFDPPEELFNRVNTAFDADTVRGMMGETAQRVFGLEAR